MFSIRQIAGMTGLFLFSTGMTQAQVQLPDGPGKNELVKVCSQCHEIAITTSQRFDRAGWEGVVADMANRGAVGTDDEFDAIINYLAKNFAPEPRPINVNKATALELQMALEISAADANAIVKYRTEHGDFKSLEELKTVPGIDVAKMDAKKSRLIFSTHESTARPSSHP